MAVNMYLKLATIPGEATGKGFEGQIAVHSFSFGGSNPVSISSASGGSSGGVPNISSLNLSKETDKSSPLLFQALCLGSHLDNATFSALKTGSSTEPYITLELTNVFVDNISWSGAGNDVAQESFSLAFGEVKITYYTQDKTGKTTKGAEFDYNIQTHSKG
jgi:type VI secretion system secreted protein Hcp